MPKLPPKPEKPDPEGLMRQCQKCKTRAVWRFSKRRLCWWCEGKPAVPTR